MKFDSSFEEIKDYFSNFDDKKNILNYLNINNNWAYNIIIETAIKDLDNYSEQKPSLHNGDIEGIMIGTLKIEFLLTVDRFENIKDFAIAWAALFTNYTKIFKINHPNIDYLQGLLNLLQLQKTMARLINVGEYLIATKNKYDSYSSVSSTFIESILRQDSEFKDNEYIQK